MTWSTAFSFNCWATWVILLPNTLFLMNKWWNPQNSVDSRGFDFVPLKIYRAPILYLRTVHTCTSNNYFVYPMVKVRKVIDTNILLSRSTMNSMWTSLLYLTCLLYLVRTSHGYFYKDNTVSDNEKQCFCEVNCRIPPIIILSSSQIKIPPGCTWLRSAINYPCLSS